MDLCSSIIAKRLQGNFIYTIYGKIDDQFHLKRPILATEKTEPENHYIYVHTGEKKMSARMFPHSRVHLQAMLLTTSILTEEEKELYDCSLVFWPDTDMQEVFNEIQKLYDEYENWIIRLNTLSRNGAALTELLDCSREILVNPLLVHGADFKFIASSSFLDENDKYAYLLTEGSKEEILSTFMEDESYRNTFKVQEAAVFPSYATGTRTIYKNIFDDQKLLVRLLAAEVIRPFQSSDLYLVEILSKYIQFSLGQVRTSENEKICTLDMVLGKLLEHQLVDDYVFNRTMTAYGWIPEHSYFCIKFLVDKLDVQNYTIKALIAELKQLIRSSCVFEFQRDIVMYVNLGRENGDTEKILASIKEFVRDNNLKAGISNVYHGFMHIFQLLYIQAERAVDIGLRYTPFKWIHHFRDIADKYIMERCTDELPANMLCAPEILEMYDYDTQNNSEYYNTLKIFLENNMQPVITAKKLFIHRTTLLYRLDKMKAIFHVDLADPGRRFFYHLSMLLMEQMGTRGN